MNKTLQERIGYTGDLQPVLKKVFHDYFTLGDYQSYSIIEMEYEDFNLVVTTTHTKFFVKLFAAFRSREDCLIYIEKIKRARSAGISQPEIYASRQHGFLYETLIEELPIRLCIMQYIDGETLFASHTPLTGKEALFITKQAALINTIPFHPPAVYDTWAVVNFIVSWNERKQYLSPQDQTLIAPLVERFQRVDIQKLPHCFVHGDLIKTNIMRDTNDHLYILDFSIASYYPRIQEIAVLLCDVFFDRSNLDLYDKLYTQTIHEYQKYIKLETVELETLPLYTTVAHAMHLIWGTYEKKVNNNQTKENEYFINLGRLGLEFLTNKYLYK